MSLPEPDRRLHPRAPIHTAVHFRAGGETLALGESLNVSAGGMLVAMGQALDPGLVVEVRFPLPFRAEPMLLMASVVYLATVDRRTSRRYSVGLRFKDATDAQVDVLGSVCRQVLARLHLRPDALLQSGEVAVAIPGVVRERPGDLAEARPAIAEKRRAPRVPSVLRVRFESEREFLDEYTTNISAQGLFVQTQQRLPPLTAIELALEVAGQDDPIRLSGMVVYNLPGDPERLEPAGLGLHLDGGEDEGMARLHALAERLLEAWGRYP